MSLTSTLFSVAGSDAARYALTGLAAVALSALLLPRLRDAIAGPAPALPADVPADVRRRIERGRVVFALAPYLPIALLRYSYDAEARRDPPSPAAAPVDERETTTRGADCASTATSGRGRRPRPRA